MNFKDIKKKYLSLEIRIPFIFIASHIILLILLAIVTYNKLSDFTGNQYEQLAKGATSLMYDVINKDKIDYYISENYSSEEYRDILKYFHKIRDSYGITYMYVYRFYIDDEGVAKGEVIFDLDEEYSDTPPQESIDWIGDSYIVDVPFSNHMEDIITGDESKSLWYEVNVEGGLISYLRPMADEDGNYLCSLCIDYNTSEIRKRNLSFIISVFLITFVVHIIIMMIVIRLLHNIVIKPMDKITNCISNLSYDEGHIFDNINELEQLDIHTGNQIDNLYNSLVTSMKESAYYLSNYNRAKDEIKEINEIVSKDALTGVRSKSAYNSDTISINKEIKRDEIVNFAVVMIDMNNLKYINDTYGHEIGNNYIIGCCRLICNAFKRSPVYRIGGDEFVAILRGDNYLIRGDLVEELKREFEDSYSNENQQEYNRFSASIGISDYIRGEDKHFEDVFNRADNDMYEQKMKFKQKHGSYR